MLSEDQQNAYNWVEAGYNLFITARAGAGKSYLINYINSNIKKNVIICGSTGISACNVGGRTLHSMFMIPPNLDKFDISRLSEKRFQRIRRCDILIIDEISMVSARLLKLINDICCLVRNSSKPFGGIQVLLFGDYLQLPPVDKGDGISLECDIWRQANIISILLTTNHRQGSDTEFYDILTRMRYNKLTQKDIDLLLQRQNYECPDNCIKLFGVNSQVDYYNKYKLNSLDPNTRHIYDMEKDGEPSLVENFLKNSLFEEQLELRLGCRVMCLINRPSNIDNIYNGSLGTVIEFRDELPVVKFDNGITLQMDWYEHEVSEPVVDSYGFTVSKNIVLSITQIPLKLAWGITIHKSQGLSFDSIFVDCSNIFVDGQTYVALSRCRTLNGLYLKNFMPQDSRCDSRIVDWYMALEKHYGVLNCL